MNPQTRIVGLLLAIHAANASASPGLSALYTLHCSGCHGEDGKGAPQRGIPDLKDSGRYLAVPSGRRYLIEVPGVSQSSLSDERTAELLNYILLRFSRDVLPTPFVPYNVDEVAAYRVDKASDAPSRRGAVLQQLREREEGLRRPDRDRSGNEAQRSLYP